jgi:adenosylhomocysteine nucleosidase
MINLLMFPLQSEITPFLGYFRELGYEISEHQSGEGNNFFRIPRLNAICAKGGHGKVQHALITQYFLNVIEGVSIVFTVGAGGGLSEDVSVFDLVVGSEILEHDYIEKFDLQARLPKFTSCIDIIKKTSEISITDFNIHLGIIASGDEDIIDEGRAAELYNETGALAVAWEGAGAARAAILKGIAFSEVRAITDNARDNVANDFSNNLPIAMRHAAEFFRELLA